MITTTTNTKGQKQTQESAVWPCPKSYHQWLNVQMVTGNKLFPSRVCSGTRSIFSAFISVSLILGSSAPSASSQMTPGWVALDVFEGRDAIQRGMDRLWEWSHVNSHQSHRQLSIHLWGQHRELMDVWGQVQRRPTKNSHRASGYEDRLREQAIFPLEKRSLWRALPEADQYMALGDL